MKVFYRISDGSYKKERYPHATKRGCLENFLKHFPKEEIIIYADNVKDETYTWLNEYGCEIIRTNGGSSAAGFRIIFDKAVLLPDDEIVYFVEDDYLHLENSRQILIEGLGRVDYVTLYDHIDKYIPAEEGGNMFVDSTGAEDTRVFLTKSRHWKLTNSTTMTFASTVKVLKEDANLWIKYTTGTYPRDFECFIELRKKGRALASPIPSLSTHCEPRWAAPLINWTEVN